MLRLLRILRLLRLLRLLKVELYARKLEEAIEDGLGSDLKVMGIEGLRVCDSSMQPWLANMPPTAIIQAAGLMGATIALREAM